MLHLLTKGKGLHFMLYIVKSERNKGSSRGLCESEFEENQPDLTPWIAHKRKPTAHYRVEL